MTDETSLEPIEKVLKDLKVDPEKGLSSEDAKNRIQQYGLNELEEKKRSFWAMLFSFFWGPIPWMIEIAAILAAILERWPDFILITALLLINAALGFVHEFKADNAIQALKQKLALKAKVLRDGKWQDIAAKDLVPGDILSVKLGNIIPADMRLLKGEYLSVDQSALTGESLPTDKKVGDIAYSGTIVKLGEMMGIVSKTGMNTFFGKTAKLVQTAQPRSHFQRAVFNIGRFLIITTLSIVAFLLVYSLSEMEISHSIHHKLGKLAIFLLVLIVAGIPVALPAVMSVTMAIGAHRMAELKAIVAKLMSIEELAGMNILCSDKTGTLTKNQLTVGDVQVFTEGILADDVLHIAALASKQDQSDAIDHAIFEKIPDKAFLKEYELLKFIPFDPVRKRTEAQLKKGSEQLQACKGAPQVVIEMCKPSEEVEKKANDAINDLAKKGFRTLGIARADAQGKWSFLGLIPLFDPPRDDTKETIERTKTMGVHIKMVTGDNVAIAKEVASAVGLGANITPMGQIKESLSEIEKCKMLEAADGFAEVFPEHKFEIVKDLQSKNNIVGMTGDGVNDAPALKQADIGVAVSNATDAARAAADLVLTEPGLMVITRAIEEARKIFGRLRSYAIYRVSETCRLLLFLLLAALIFHIHPLSAIMIILIALLNDIPIMMIAYDKMKVEQKPVFWSMKEVLTIAIGLSVVGVISTFGLFWIGERVWELSFEKCRTLSFMAILCGGNLTIYLTRNTGAVFSYPLPEWRFFLATLFSQVVGTLMSVYGLGTEDFVGIGWKYVGYSWAYIAVWFFICMLTKMALYKGINMKSSSHPGLVQPVASGK